MVNKKNKQSQKFIDKARELETDEDEAVFDDKLGRIVKVKPDKKDGGPSKSRHENEPSD